VTTSPARKSERTRDFLLTLRLKRLSTTSLPSRSLTLDQRILVVTCRRSYTGSGNLSFSSKASIACFLAALALVPAAQAHGKQHKVTAVQVFLDAANRTDLRSTGSPPFELLSDITLDIRGTRLNGNYLLLWVSPDQWREEVVFPGYLRIKVKTASGIWLHRSLNYEVPSVVDLDNAINFGEQLRRYAKLHPGKFKIRRALGTGVECSRVHTDGFVHQVDDFVHLDASDEDFCFSSGQPVLNTVLFPKGATLAPNLTSIEYSDFVPFGAKLYPHTIRLFSQNDPFLTLSVERLASLVQPRAADFAPPQDALFEATCTDPVKLKLLNQVLPVYPSGEAAAGHTARVILYVLIAADGSVKRAHVVFPAPPDFDAAALAAVRQWRFRPESCSGKPTALERYVIASFRLR
jgi:TonB family protein